MADLQDTNAATEEIYGPLLIVDCPVTDEMISQKLDGRQPVRGKALSLCLRASFINQMFWVEATSRSAPRKEPAGRKHDKDERGKEKLSRQISGIETEGEWVLTCKVLSE